MAGEPADEATLKDLVFAWRAIRCVKSNAILLAHDQATVGIGMGQVNRVAPAIWPSIVPTRWPTAPIAPPVRSLRPTRSSRSQMAPRR